MIVLGIETSCDETGIAILKDGKHVLSNALYSQVFIHRRYGGVVPELAARKHLNKLVPLTKRVLSDAGFRLKDIDLISVTQGPGLIGPLLVGLSYARALSFASGIPVIGVNHLEAHLLSSEFGRSPDGTTLGLIVSGGHTELISCRHGFRYRLEGATRDDAAGEALDKVAKAMGLPYPGGALLEKIGRCGNRKRYGFSSVRMKDRSDDFSFSGLKTAGLQIIRSGRMTKIEKRDLAASFQEAVCRHLVDVTLRVARRRKIRKLVGGGGVAANERLRGMFDEKLDPREEMFFPDKGLCTDNALMVAYAGYRRYKAGARSGPFLDAKADLRLA